MWTFAVVCPLKIILYSMSSLVRSKYVVVVTYSDPVAMYMKTK